MNYQTGIKNLLIFTAFLITTLAFTPQTKASDYQYKILDPKYNPAAEQVLDTSTGTIEEVNLPVSSGGFDFGRFLAILAAVAFPIFIISLAVKTFKEVTQDVPGRLPQAQETNSATPQKSQNTQKAKPKQVIGNVKIPPSNRNNVQQKSSIPQKPVHTSPIQKTAAHKNRNQVKSATVSSQTKEFLKMKTSRNINEAKSAEYATSPVNKKKPMLINTAPLTGNKGFCLVEYNQKYSLIGYINNEIFLLNQFNEINTNEIRSRLSETVNNNDRYIVRLGNYKALVEVSETKMNVLLEL